MCEPAHSVVQYSPDDNDDNRLGPPNDMGGMLSKLGAFAKRIGRWFHISKMGKGHTGASMVGRQQLLYLPESVDYEGFWWQKGKFEIDGYNKIVDPVQFSAAEEYHKRACIGSIKIFRRFLEESMKNSLHPTVYSTFFLEGCLSGKGRDQAQRKISSLLPRNSRIIRGTIKERFIKVIMGFTRKRELFVPEWSDDTLFWS